MTLEEYIRNPMGKDNSILNAATRELSRARYKSKFDNIILRENGKIEYFLYYDKSSNTYWAHMKIPSEVVRKFYYDVVFKFTANPKTKGGQSDLFKYEVQFFSNDPAFVFMYTNTLIQKKMFIRELSSKMSREALKEKAKEKNPKDNLGYIKSIYFAYLLFENRKLNKVSRFEAEAASFNPKALLKNIRPADEVIAERQEEGKHVSSKKKINLDEKTAKNVARHVSNMSRVNVVNKTNSVGNIKKSKAIKSTKKIK